MILKSDGEPAIVAGREALARCHGGDVTPEQPPPGEHQGNGLAEVSGRHIRDQSRVMKLHLQHMIDRQVEEGEAIMPWLVRWAAMAMSRFKKGKKDGKTRTSDRKVANASWKWYPSVRRCCTVSRR